MKDARALRGTMFQDCIEDIQHIVHQYGDLFAIQSTQLPQVGQEYESQSRADAEDGGQQVLLLPPQKAPRKRLPERAIELAECLVQSST